MTLTYLARGILLRIILMNTSSMNSSLVTAILLNLNGTIRTTNFVVVKNYGARTKSEY
jgi:hypothetical protein